MVSLFDCCMALFGLPSTVQGVQVLIQQLHQDPSLAYKLLNAHPELLGTAAVEAGRSHDAPSETAPSTSRAARAVARQREDVMLRQYVNPGPNPHRPQSPERARAGALRRQQRVRETSSHSNSSHRASRKYRPPWNPSSSPPAAGRMYVCATCEGYPWCRV